jgi:geranylgeranyl diphosphate synthase type I
MRSAVAPGSTPDTLARFELALEAAIRRHDGPSPVTAMIHEHFGYGPGVIRRGKRLRPRLALCVAQEEGAPADAAMDAACAIEILHNYSLVHDDIEDGDRMRHGRPTVWATHGIAHGINAGDAMCAVSYLALLESGRQNAETTVAMTRVLQEAHLAMCAGQARDIAFESESAVSMVDYLAMIGGKTAALFGAACELGALAAGASLERARAYAQLGRTYGLAFQIEDDVLGTWGDSAATGKPSGADIAKRKWSFPIVWAMSGPPSAARDAIIAAYGDEGALDAPAVRQTISALDALEARAAAQAAAQQYFAASDEVARAADIDRSGNVRTFLSDAVGRTS